MPLDRMQRCLLSFAVSFSLQHCHSPSINPMANRAEELRAMALENPIGLQQTLQHSTLDADELNKITCGLPRAPDGVAKDFEQIEDKSGSVHTLNLSEFHSRKGAPYTIFLDFDGQTVTDTLWNQYYGNNQEMVFPPVFDLSRDLEKAKALAIWQEVSEHYSAFDVDVTLEEPFIGSFGGGEADVPKTALRVLITQSLGTIPLAGGIAFYGSAHFSKDTPVLAFPSPWNRVPDIGLIISHEVGHAFGLAHDGSSVDGEYSRGMNNWGPIMGAPYGMARIQWSAGDYDGATNRQNDTAILQEQLGLAGDDHSSNAADATGLLRGERIYQRDVMMRRGVIDSNGDSDTFTFSFDVDQGSVSIWTEPVDGMGNTFILSKAGDLKVNAELRRSDGSLVVASDGNNQSGSLTANLTRGQYFYTVRGGGLAGAFSAYGSLGRYIVRATSDTFGPIATTPAAGEIISVVSSVHRGFALLPAVLGATSYVVEATQNWLDWTTVATSATPGFVALGPPYELNTTYYYRAYATNEGGSGYRSGAVKFHTPMY